MELALVLEAREEELSVWPVSEEPAFATNQDLVLPSVVLGFAAVLHRSLPGHLLPEQLDEQVGVVTAGQHAMAEPGPPILSEVDPRTSIAVERGERWLPYFEPAEDLRMAATLGELVALRRGRQRLSLAELASQSGMSEKLVSQLEQDDIELLTQVAPKQLGRMLSRLAVLSSAGLVRRIRLAALATMPPDPSFAPAFRRALPGERKPEFGEADRYTVEVVDELAQSFWPHFGGK